MLKRRDLIDVAWVSCPWALRAIGRMPMLQWALVAFFLLWGGSQYAFAHSSDFVFARWSQDQSDGSVELSLSIQISDNPNIESRQQAVDALISLMQVRSGFEGEFVSVADVAKARFENNTSFPQDSPVPIGGAGLEALESGVVEEKNGIEHEILTLNWEWNASPDEKQMSFFLRDDCQQNVVFWWAEAQEAELSPGKEVPWQIMLAGDESFPVALSSVIKEEREDVEARGIRWEIFLVLGAALAGGFLIAGRRMGK